MCSACLTSAIPRRSMTAVMQLQWLVPVVRLPPVSKGNAQVPEEELLTDHVRYEHDPQEYAHISLKPDWRKRPRRDRNTQLETYQYDYATSEKLLVVWQKQSIASAKVSALYLLTVLFPDLVESQSMHSTSAILSVPHYYGYALDSIHSIYIYHNGKLRILDL